MPSTVGVPKNENREREEKPNIVNEHLVVNGSPKIGISTPVLLVQNGARGAEDDEKINACETANKQLKDILEEFEHRLKLLRVNDQVRELQTTLRDR